MGHQVIDIKNLIIKEDMIMFQLRLKVLHWMQLARVDIEKHISNDQYI